MEILLFLAVMFWLGAESGASFSWSKTWQEFGGLNLKQVPEILTGLILAGISVYGYGLAGVDLDRIISTGIGSFEIGASVALIAYVLSAAIIYAGIQSATWMFLRWETHTDPNTNRSSTTKPVVDWLAEKIGGWKLGQEGYAWTAATLKGIIITLPMGGLGGILFALGYEIGSHAEGRVKRFNPHIIAEGLSFVGLGIYALGFLYLCRVLGS